MIYSIKGIITYKGNQVNQKANVMRHATLMKWCREHPDQLAETQIVFTHHDDATHSHIVRMSGLWYLAYAELKGLDKGQRTRIGAWAATL